MYNGMNDDQVTYANPPIPLPAFLSLITNVTTTQQAVRTRVLGARENRDAALGYLLTGMGVERTFIEALANANPSRGAAIITNGGLVLAGTGVHTKPLLALKNGKQSCTITCIANVGLLVGAGTNHPSQRWFLNWQITLDGGKTFSTLPSTTLCKTLVTGLTPLTTVGVRVSLTNAEGPGEWSQGVTILVL
jgi:hypothetical protein